MLGGDELYGADDACDWISRRVALPGSEVLNIRNISVYIIILFISEF